MAEASSLLSLEALTFQTARAALEQGAAAIAAGATVFDLGAVKTADSSGVALMLAWERRAKAAGRSLTFVNVPANLHTLAGVYGVEPLLAKG